MKKRSIALRLGVFALALTLITASLSSGTLAKYRTEKTVNGKFIVAAWDPVAAVTKGGGGALTLDADSKFNLYDTITSGTIKNANALSTNRIAPGTKGAFAVQVNALGDNGTGGNKLTTTEVALEYQIKMYRDTDDGGTFPDNLKFWIGSDQTNSVALGTSNSTNPIKVGEPGVINAGVTGSAAKKEVVVNWEWPYDDAGNTGSVDGADVDAGNDAADGTSEYAITVVVSMTQVNPGVAGSTGA